MGKSSDATKNHNDHTQLDKSEHNMNTKDTAANNTTPPTTDKETRMSTLSHHKENDDGSSSSSSSKHSKRNVATAPDSSSSNLKDRERDACDDEDDEEPSSTHPFLSASTDEKTEEEDAEKGEGIVGTSTDNSPHPPGLPVDRGWAWVVMITQFVLTLLMVGYGRALSMFFLEFIDMFHVPVTSVTVALGIMTAAFGFGNLMVSHFLMSRFTIRKIVLTGTIINAVFIGLTALAPNMLIVTITHAFIGFSHALILVPGTTLLGHYFHKRRSFAMAVASTGLSVSALIFPPLTQFLITSYGARGALLLVSGIQLHCMVAACLLRPVSWYARKKGRSETDQPQSQVGENTENCNKSNMQLDNCLSQKGGCDDGAAENTTTTITRLLDESEQHQDTHVDASLQEKSSSHHIVLSASLSEKPFLSSQPESFSSEEVLNLHNHHKTRLMSRVFTSQQSCPADHTPRHQANLQDQLMSASSLRSLQRLSALTPSVVDVCGSAMSLATDDFFSSTSINHNRKGLREDDGDLTKKSGGCSRCKSVMSNIIDLSLFKNWLFLLIVTYLPLGFSASFIGFFFPSLGVGNGLSRPKAALLMTVAGGVDLVSRLVVGYIADQNLLKRTHIVIISMTIMGIACQFCSFYTSFSLLAMYAVIYGLVGGVCNTLFSVVIIDLLGLSLLGKAMALVLLVNSIYTSINHVLIGGLVDVSGSFAIPFNYVGACLFASSLILLTEPLAQRLEARRVKKLERNASITRAPESA